jgi:hypothetical protein
MGERKGFDKTKKGTKRRMRRNPGPKFQLKSESGKRKVESRQVCQKVAKRGKCREEPENANANLLGGIQRQYWRKGHQGTVQALNQSERPFPGTFGTTSFFSRRVSQDNTN